jgi:hypothetical protein
MMSGPDTASSPAPATAQPLGSPDVHGRPRDALNTDLTAVATSLHEQYDVRLGADAVDAEIRLAADRFANARIRAFVPLFVRRFAGKGLRDSCLARVASVEVGQTWTSSPSTTSPTLRR